MKGFDIHDYFRRYLDAFLPESHPIMQDLASRRKLRIIMGVGGVVILIFLTRLPVIYGHTPLIAQVVGIMCLSFIGVLIFIIRSQGKYFLELGFLMVMVATAVVTFNSYHIGKYPPVNLPYIVVMVILLHFLYGRWIALTVLVIHWAVHFPFLFADASGSFSSPDRALAVPFWRIRHYVNVLVAGIIVWLVSEAYDRFRNETETKLTSLQAIHNQELEFARTVQQGLLPRDSGAGPYRFTGMMQPAAQVGGDYFDVVPTKKYTWFAVGDVTGHGVQAGLLVMHVRSLLHYCLNVQKMNRASDVLIQINNSFFESIMRLFQKSFMTFVLLRMDNRGNVVYAGSHLSILVYRKATDRLESYSTQGVWLGVNRLEAGRDRNLESEMKLLPGDIVFLYTDGFTEARNRAGIPFGLDGLLGAIQKGLTKDHEVLEEIQSTILGEFQRFMDDREPEDDLTLLTIRRSQ